MLIHPYFGICNSPHGLKWQVMIDEEGTGALFGAVYAEIAIKGFP